MHEAVTANLLIETSISPEVEYDFAHTVLREVAHEGLTRPRRLEAHRDVFALIESHYSGRLEDQSEWLARHAVLGELWEQAGRYQGLGAERAIARGSYDEAIAGLRSALRSYERSTRSLSATEHAIDQLGTLRNLLAATEVASGEGVAALARAEELARSVGDQVRLAGVWAHQSAQQWVLGQNIAAIEKARASLDIANQTGDVLLHALALARLGVALHAVGDFVEAADRLRECRSLLSGDLRFVRLSTTPTTSILAGGFLVSTLCELGLYDEAERTVDDVTEIATSLRDVHSLGSAQVTRCILAVARCDVDAAIHPLEMLRAAAKAAGAVQILQIIETLLGRAKLVAGDLPGALELLKSASGHGVTQRGSVDRLSNVWFAEALAASGAVGQAQTILDRVEVEAENHAEAATLVHCWATRGRIAQTVGDAAAAKAAFGRALKAASTLSMRAVVERCEAGLAAVAAMKIAAPGA